MKASAEGERPSSDELVTAYDAVCRAYERIDDFRAKLLGLLPASTGAGLFLLARTPPTELPLENSTTLALAGAFGALVTVGLFLYEERGIQNCIRLATIGGNLEKAMDLDMHLDVHLKGQFVGRSHSVLRVVNEPVASGIVYSTVLAVWVFVGIASFSTLWAGLSAGLAALISLFLTRAFYWWVTLHEETARGDNPTKNWWFRRYSAWLRKHGPMQADITREGHRVAVFRMTRHWRKRRGDYSWDCLDPERERFSSAVGTIIKGLQEPSARTGYGDGGEPGDQCWFTRVLHALKTEGYEYIVLDVWGGTVKPT